MRVFTKSQTKVLAQFFSNMAVVWLAASFIGINDILFVLRYATPGLLSLILALLLVKEVE